ncbi:hypothetical protein LTR84_005047 [Exophiala bonariae]|uniref:RING-type domain-containing protein n=1 Tax=Exophiala bonariae TaxID=1690606 RepID=A0AAV9NQB4_9EURO|nr:hypothetical protein LTR84_005047 [Exophiala bonariae]
MAAVNRLCQDLGIKHPLDRSTCIGYGKAKPTCGMAVAEASRYAALNGLEKICNALAQNTDPGSLRRELNAVAHLLHCKRWHQDQAEAKSQQWEARLHRTNVHRQQQQEQWRQPQSFSEPAREPHRQRVSNRESSSTRIDPPTGLSQSERNALEIQAQTLQMLRQMQSMLEEYQRNGLPIPQSPPRSTSSSTGSPERTRLLVENTSHVSEVETAESDNDDNDSESGDEPDLPMILFRPISEPRQRRESTSSSSSWASTSSTASNRSVSSRSSPSSRSECGICLSRLSRVRAQNWTCDTCHNKAHLDCFDEWVATSPEDNVRCIYW